MKQQRTTATQYTRSKHVFSANHWTANRLKIWDTKDKNKEQSLVSKNSSDTAQQSLLCKCLFCTSDGDYSYN